MKRIILLLIVFIPILWECEEKQARKQDLKESYPGVVINEHMRIVEESTGKDLFMNNENYDIDSLQYKMSSTDNWKSMTDKAYIKTDSGYIFDIVLGGKVYLKYNNFDIDTAMGKRVDCYKGDCFYNGADSLHYNLEYYFNDKLIKTYNTKNKNHRELDSVLYNSGQLNNNDPIMVVTFKKDMHDDKE